MLARMKVVAAFFAKFHRPFVSPPGRQQLLLAGIHSLAVLGHGPGNRFHEFAFSPTLHSEISGCGGQFRPSRLQPPPLTSVAAG
jgi:hypothetical protein